VSSLNEVVAHELTPKVIKTFLMNIMIITIIYISIFYFEIVVELQFARLKTLEYRLKLI